jgi:carbonic anhydrase
MEPISLTHKTSRRDFLSLSGLALGGLVLASCAPNAGQAGEPTPEPAVSSADEALQRLKDGNKRYVARKTVDPNQTELRRVEVAKGQDPFAAILGCVDSRVPPELVFDRGLGDLFVIRTAGQVLDKAVIGSIEFGIAELGIPLLVVLGHENCGAVKATIEALEKHSEAEGSIGYLVEEIAPAVEKASGQPGDVVDNAVRANVELIVNRLKESQVLSAALKEGRLKIAGGRYDLDTGAVEFTV